MVIGDRIRYYRNEAGISQENLAIMVHVSKSYISKIENNFIIPNDDLLKNIKRKLGIPNVTLSESEILDIKKELLQWQSLMKNVQYDEALALLPVMEKKSVGSNEPCLINFFNLFHFRLMLVLGKRSEAKLLYGKLEKSFSIMSSEEKFYFHHFTSLYYAMNYEYPTAIEHLTNAVNIDLVENFNEIGVYYSLANIYSRTNSITKSIIYSHITLTKEPACQDIRIRLYTNILLARSYSESGESKLALSSLKECLSNAIKFRDSNIIPIIYHLTGRVQNKMGLYDDALSSFDKAISYSDPENVDLEDKLHYAYTLINKGDLSKAIAMSEEYSRIARAANNEIMTVLFESIIHINNIDSSDDSIDFIAAKSLPMLIKFGMYLKAIEYCNMLIKHFKRKRLHKQALVYSELANTYYRIIFEGDVSE